MRENLFLFRFVIVVLFAVVLFLLIRRYRFTKLKRRVARCSVSSVTGVKKHFFDRVEEQFYHLVKKLSLIFQKCRFFRWWSHLYDSSFHEVLVGMDLLAMKWISCLVFLLFYLGIVLFPGKEFSWLALLLFVSIGFFVPNFFYFFQQKSYEERIRRDFTKAVVMMRQVVSTKRTLYQAISVVVLDFSGPMKEQFHLFLLDLERGLSSVDAARNLQKRVPLLEVSLFLEMFTLYEGTNGDLTEAFALLEKQLWRAEVCSSSFRSRRSQIRNQILVVVFAPIMIVGVLFFLFPDPYRVLLTTNIGYDLLFFIFLLDIIYLLLLKIFLREEVGR